MGFGPTGEVARRPRATAGEWGHGPPCSAPSLSSDAKEVQMFQRRTSAPPLLDRQSGYAHRVI